MGIFKTIQFLWLTLELQTIYNNNSSIWVQYISFKRVFHDVTEMIFLTIMIVYSFTSVFTIFVFIMKFYWTLHMCIV